jgi:hypothetical protein
MAWKCFWQREFKQFEWECVQGKSCH